MRVVLKTDFAYGDVSLAGLSSRQRMLAVLANFDPKPLLPEEGVCLEQEPNEILWVEGLFPLISASELQAFVGYAQSCGSAVWSCGLSNWGIYCGPAKPALQAKSFRVLVEGHQRFQSSAPFQPLRDSFDLARMIRELFHWEANRAMANGAILLCPDQTYIDSGVHIAPGAIIGPNVTIAGHSSIGAGSRVEIGSVLTDAILAESAHVKPYTVIEDSYVGPGASVGPFAYVRPGSELGQDSRVGNFVEVKKTKLGRGSKANHLTYLGDATIGEFCNIGAGTITCNYDGYNKSPTILGDRVFIGSDSQLVAPVEIGSDSFVAAGTTVTRDVPPNSLVLSRAPLVQKEGHAETIRNRARLKKETAEAAKVKPLT